MGSFGRDIFSAILLYERRYFRTIRDFLKNSGKMVMDYSRGKRRFYSPPIQFFFFFATLILILRKLFFSPAEKAEYYNFGKISSNGGELNSEGARIIQLVETTFRDVVWFSKEYNNYFDLGIPIVFGLLIFLFYHRRFNLAESFAFGFYAMTFVIKIPTLLLLPFTGSAVRMTVLYVISIGVLAWISSYLGRRKWLNIPAGIFIFILSIISYLTLSVIIVLSLRLIGFEG